MGTSAALWLGPADRSPGHCSQPATSTRIPSPRDTRTARSSSSWPRAACWGLPHLPLRSWRSSFGCARASHERGRGRLSPSAWRGWLAVPERLRLHGRCRISCCVAVPAPVPAESQASRAPQATGSHSVLRDAGSRWADLRRNGQLSRGLCIRACSNRRGQRGCCRAATSCRRRAGPWPCHLSQRAGHAAPAQLAKPGRGCRARESRANESRRRPRVADACTCSFSGRRRRDLPKAIDRAVNIQRSDPSNLLLALRREIDDGDDDAARDIAAEIAQAWPAIVATPDGRSSLAKRGLKRSRKGRSIGGSKEDRPRSPSLRSRCCCALSPRQLTIH